MVDISRKARTVEQLERVSDPVATDVVEVARDRVDAAAASAPGAAISLTAPDEAWIEADPLIEAIFDTLLENAIEHNDREPRIDVTITTDDRVVTIAVADNGPGIPEDQRAIVQGRDETELRHGNGLGLWLVKWFVDLHDGTLAIEDNEPRGATVRVSLPRGDTERGVAWSTDVLSPGHIDGPLSVLRSVRGNND